MYAILRALVPMHYVSVFWYIELWTGLLFYAISLVDISVIVLFYDGHNKVRLGL